MAFSSAFLRLWISDETHMIQMPWIVLMLAAALRRRGLLLGVMTGIATLTFVSNVLIGIALARRRLGTFAIARALSATGAHRDAGARDKWRMSRRHARLR